MILKNKSFTSPILNAARSIGPAIQNHNIYAGYNEVPRIMRRLFLPIFGVKGKWYPVCDIANIPEKDHYWCTNNNVFGKKQLGFLQGYPGLVFQALKIVHGE